MKHAGLIWAAIKGLIVIGLVGWLLLQIRENFVYGNTFLTWGVFVGIAAGALGIAFAFSAKGCLREINKLKKLRDQVCNKEE